MSSNLRRTISAWSVIFAYSSVACDPERKSAERALASAAPAVRAEAVEVLARRNDPRITERVAPFTSDPSPRVRRAAVAAIGRLAPKAHLRRLVDRLRDGDFRVRLAAVHALGRSGDRRARAALVALLDEDRPMLRRAVERALVALGLPLEEQTAAQAKRQLAEHTRALNGAEAKDRARATRMLGRGGFAASVAPLLTKLDDPDVTVARGAARALGRIGGARSLAALSRVAAADDPRRRAIAAAGLAAVRRPTRAIDRLLAQLVADKVASVKMVALTELGRTDWCGSKLDKDRGGVARAVCAALEDPQESIALAAIQAAAQCSAAPLCQATLVGWARQRSRQRAPGDDIAVSLWQLLSHSPDSEVSALLLDYAKRVVEAHLSQASRWVSAKGWRGIDGKSGGPEVPDARSRVQQLLSAYPVRRDEAEAAVDPLLPPRVSSQTSEHAIELLAGRPSAAAWLLGIAEKSTAPPWLRAGALNALAAIRELGDPSAGRRSALLKQALESNQPTMRAAALDACQVLGADGAASSALQGLEVNDFELQAASAQCLGRLQHRAAVNPLLRLLKREPMAEVIVALGLIGDARAVDPLVALLTAPGRQEPEQRRLVIAALAAIGEARALEPLGNELGHRDPGVRRAAARALRRLGGAEAKTLLRRCREDFDAQVRKICGGPGA